MNVTLKHAELVKTLLQIEDSEVLDEVKLIKKNHHHR